MKLDFCMYEYLPLPDGVLNCAMPFTTDWDAPVLLGFVVHWLKFPLVKLSLNTVLGVGVGVGVGVAVGVGVGVGVGVAVGVGVGVAVEVGVGVGVGVGGA